jgi:hypothetical protein
VLGQAGQTPSRSDGEEASGVDDPQDDEAKPRPKTPVLVACARAAPSKRDQPERASELVY